MKKLVYVMLGVATLVAFTGCKSKTKTPGEMAKSYVETMKDGDYDRFIEIIVFADTVPVEAARAESKKVLNTYHKPKVQEKGGIKVVQISSESITPDGKNAQVALNQSYNNGDEEIIIYDMVLVDDNTWKVRAGNDREVWRIKTADGQHLSFKVKENAHKQVLKEDIDGERDFLKEKEGDNKEVLKVKKDGEKDVIKVKDKGDKEVIKVKEDGKKTVTEIEK